LSVAEKGIVDKAQAALGILCTVVEGLVDQELSNKVKQQLNPWPYT